MANETVDRKESETTIPAIGTTIEGRRLLAKECNHYGDYVHQRLTEKGVTLVWYAVEKKLCASSTVIHPCYELVDIVKTKATR